GQKFIPATWDKLKRLNEMRKERHPALLIQLDGGVNLENAVRLKEAGVDILVAGAAVFGAPDVTQRVKDFVALLAE
ncbi:MAG TPA: ribulose-phosphate 3-epimerase, partial [Anaerovoracaceae bacterium]|nr:ribulose-phosphate 3-epimerase [Anaerovoracaceae bacterium]